MPTQPTKSLRSAMKTIRDRFWSKVDIWFGITDEDCWNWIGETNDRGYGQIKLNLKRKGAHVVSWILNRGVVGAMFVLHSCDNPACINPSHLFLGTQRDNMADMIKKGRHANSVKTHCRHGHPYSGENLIVRTYEYGTVRLCKICYELEQKNRMDKRRKLIASNNNPNLNHKEKE